MFWIFSIYSGVLSGFNVQVLKHILSCLWILELQMLIQAPKVCIRILLKSWDSHSVLHPFYLWYLKVRYQQGQPALETWELSCTMSPTFLLGSWHEGRNPKSTRCNICLEISLGLPKRQTQVSLRDRTGCWSLSQGLLPPWRWWEGDAGSSSWWEDLEWLLPCTEDSRGQSKPCPPCYTCQTLLIPPCHQD